MTTQPSDDRLEHAVDRATQIGDQILYTERRVTDLGDPSRLLAAILEEQDELAPRAHHTWSLWRTSSSWRVTLGVVYRENVIDLSLLSSDLYAMRHHCSDDTTREHLTLWGGIAFDPSDPSRSPLWERGYGGVDFWFPWIEFGVDETSSFTQITLDIGPEFEEEWGDRGPEISERERAHRERRDAFALAARLVERASQIEVAMHPCEGGTIETPFAQEFEDLVDEVASSLQEDREMEKVVLARTIQYISEREIEIPGVVARLSARFPMCTTFALSPPLQDPFFAEPPSVFVGATPECLVRRDRQGRVYVDALAGTAPIETPDEELLGRDKDRHEHALVVDHIREVLSSCTHELHVPSHPQVDSLSTLKHLRTPIEARTTRDLATLAAALHPTPAVCGHPVSGAMEWIRRREGALGVDRGWYAGALGWIGLDGSGRLDVALRCALIDGARATLFCGAGIVAASRGADELAETRLKADALLDVLSASHDQGGGME